MRDVHYEYSDHVSLEERLSIVLAASSPLLPDE